MILRILYRYGVKNKSANATAGSKPKGAGRFERLAFYALLATVLTVAKLWLAFLLFWVLPAFTILPMCMRVRRSRTP